MVDETHEQLNTLGKVQVLLYEYAGLRMEILHRTGHMYQLLAIGGALFLWLLIPRPIDWRLWVSLVMSLVIVSLFGWFLHRDINKAAARLRELEQEINERAGEELLVWETRWGGAVTGYWGRAKPLSEKDLTKRTEVESAVVAALNSSELNPKVTSREHE
jgi:hypothetical protein